MGMFYETTFPVYEKGVESVRRFVIRDDHYDDIWHDFVPSGVTLLVEDWSTEDFADVVLRKQGCVWVVTDLKEAPSRLPDLYYEMKTVVEKNQQCRGRTHPWL